MGCRRGSSRKRVVPGMVRTNADVPVKATRQWRMVVGSTTSSSFAGNNCKKAKCSIKEAVLPIRRTAKKEDIDNAKASCEKSSSQCFFGELSTKALGLCPPERTSLAPLKLKLQLYPIDEITCKGLEKDKHNPHLELTLGAQKKISSVLKHLSNKWGKSSIALGELMLYPYEVQQKNFASYRRWTFKDSDITAADVFVAIGCPSVFRLRYGWFSSLEPATSQLPHVGSISFEDCLHAKDLQNTRANMVADVEKPSCDNSEVVVVEKQLSVKDMPLSGSSFLNASTASVSPLNRAVHQGDVRLGNGTSNSSTLWIDCLSNMSMGDLWKETSGNTFANHCDPDPMNKDSCLFSSDSFDAAIAALMSRHQSTSLLVPTTNMSIWDAEETCHAFPVQMTATSREEAGARSCDTDVRGAFSKFASSNAMKSCDSIEVGGPAGLLQDHASVEPLAASQPHEQNLENPGNKLRITDINWCDSLHPLDLGLPSSRQIDCGDSISLSGLIASSLDAFQNCSFFK